MTTMIECHIQGKTLSEISEIFSVPRATVHNWIKNHPSYKARYSLRDEYIKEYISLAESFFALIRCPRCKNKKYQTIKVALSKKLGVPLPDRCKYYCPECNLVWVGGSKWKLQ